MRIMSYRTVEIVYDDASDFSDYVGTSNSEGDGAVPASLIEIALFEQYLTIAPLPKLYGRQFIELAVTDGGNDGTAYDSDVIHVNIEIQITKNPNDMETYEFFVYWKRTVSVVASDFFDNADTVDKDESDGLNLVGITVAQASSDLVSAQRNDKGEVTITGITKLSTANATAQVTVGASPTVYNIPIVIRVGDNGRPEWRLNKNLVSYGTTTTDITQEEMTADNTWIISVDELFIDTEGDEMLIVSASSNKSALVSVTVDKEANTIRVNFKGRGNAMISLRVSDAVTTYSYSFRVSNSDLPEANFFIGMVSRVQERPALYIVLFILALIILLVLCIVAGVLNKRRTLREEVEAMLVSEMELEDTMVKLASSASENYRKNYGYLPPSGGTIQQLPPMQQMQPPMQPFMPNTALSQPPQDSGAIGLNPGGQDPSGEMPPENSGDGSGF